MVRWLPASGFIGTRTVAAQEAAVSQAPLEKAPNEAPFVTGLSCAMATDRIRHPYRQRRARKVGDLLNKWRRLNRLNRLERPYRDRWLRWRSASPRRAQFLLIASPHLLLASSGQPASRARLPHALRARRSPPLTTSKRCAGSTAGRLCLVSTAACNLRTSISNSVARRRNRALSARSRAILLARSVSAGLLVLIPTPSVTIAHLPMLTAGPPRDPGREGRFGCSRVPLT
jgi:hypothetical protein